MAATATQEPQESFLSAIRKSQEITLHAIKAWVETIEFFTPKVSYAHLPLADRVPNAHDVVASSFDFAERVLASQRKFADDALKLTGPLLPVGSGSSAPRLEAAGKE
jgi:hypothetical protein